MTWLDTWYDVRDIPPKKVDVYKVLGSCCSRPFRAVWMGRYWIEIRNVQGELRARYNPNIEYWKFIKKDK